MINEDRVAAIFDENVVLRAPFASVDTEVRLDPCHTIRGGRETHSTGRERDPFDLPFGARRDAFALDTVVVCRSGRVERKGRAEGWSRELRELGNARGATHCDALGGL